MRSIRYGAEFNIPVQLREMKKGHPSLRVISPKNKTRSCTMNMYSRVTYTDRCHISAWLQDNISILEIALRLNLHKSTIYREIHRNGSRRSYNPDFAQHRAKKRYQKCRRPQKLKGAFKNKVITYIKKDWSPEQISHRFKNEGHQSISHESIYRYLRSRKNEFRRHLRRLRRQAGCGRYKQKGTHKNSFQPNISKRPRIANERRRFGDIERDIMFASGKTPILVCVDRKSRLTKIRLVKDLKAETVNRETLSISDQLPFLTKTVTSDRGAEFKVPLETIKTYYCDPQAPQQRGTVENTIGLIRQYIKRKSSICIINQKQLNKIETILNNRPRKVLDYRTPLEVVTNKKVALVY